MASNDKMRATLTPQSPLKASLVAHPGALHATLAPYRPLRAKLA